MGAGETNKFVRPTTLTNFVAVMAAFVACVSLPWPAGAGDTDGFPEVNAVLQGRAFTNDFDRDVFFLRQVRQHYPAHWPSLLAANISVGEYVISPEKMRRFVKEVGAAGEKSDDSIACANLAAIVCVPDFYSNPDASHPEIQQAAAVSLIKIGPTGESALAAAFTQEHYRADPGSLETVADAIAASGAGGSNLVRALAATALTFTADNTGGSYPRCTEAATRCLLSLTNGASALLSHLNTNEVFANPGRFQSVVDGIAAAHAASLAVRLEQIDSAVKARLAAISPGPDPYRDDLSDLENRIERAASQLRPAAR